MERPFKSEKVIEEKISDGILRGYYVGFDKNQFRLQQLVEIICDVFPEFCFGVQNISQNEMRRRLREAAIRIYTTDKYKRRGEFGEVILHLLLRDFCGTYPLVSKFLYKDSTNSTVKGFDGVHVVVNGDEKKLWLGESKLYTDGSAGIKDLAKDLKNHLKEDYLRKEFILISPKIPFEVPNREFWLNLIDEKTRLDEIFNGIVIPLVCTFSSKIFEKHNDNTEKFLEEFNLECHTLLKEFQDEGIATNVDVLLLLLPIPCKDTLVTELHKKLKYMQNI